MRANRLIGYQYIGSDKSATNKSDIDLLVTIITDVIVVFVSLAQSHNRKRHRNEVLYVISSEKKQCNQLI